ncbi:MAG: hypothetical protein A2455_00905 [Ignavibacteria bacterium RIFOXYC2_FULL_35_16]|nr:MAG: hypothetical protein A2058_06375 [Ignavibacteria bacterium GWA2_36_19]OGU60577.1 MAG: hypothetical protein A2X60_06590 [Ignavibacteria bacterium GWF2_35_20]OGU84404.1 MAG: hypothetical protein A3K31_00305 [Ignavibacteria bacterium RIFOXYA12_FULL_35_25]OGU90402.1 MAG: hypothetical protein A2492_06350 [Ignavibacteria bacterium RIFOXYC12_FULL_35_11]OGU97358.1 MAG: hypothetical protein A2347_06375 [Ignavibacteria bacterium RIFOXYB12_FULL_35_14]OGU99560.1 MAG: hypothetical protein A2455_009
MFSLIIKYICTILLFVSFHHIYPQKANISFQHFGIDQGMSSSSVGAIFQDRKGYMWFCNSNGIDRYDGYNFVSYKYPRGSTVLINYFPGTISEDYEGNIWFPSYNGGLEKLNPETHTFTNYKLDPQHANTGWSNIVISVYIDSKDVLWVGSGDGFYKFNKDKQTFTSYRHDQNDLYSLGNNAVDDIYEDRSGTLWLATGGGLDRFDRETNQFYHYWHYPNNYWGDSKTGMHWLQAIIEDNAGVLWLGTDGGLVEFDTKSNKFTLYRHDPKIALVGERNIILTLCEDASGNLWLGTMAGLDIFNKKTKTFSSYVHDEKNPKSLSSNIINSVFRDRTCSIWISTKQGGVNRVDHPNPLFTKYIFDPSKKGTLSSDKVLVLYRGKMGTVWVCTWSGLEIFDAKSETFKTYNFDFTSVFQDNSGNILVSPKSGGLYKFNINDRWTCYIDSTKGVDSEQFYSFYSQRSDQFWLGTIKGDLYLFNPFTLNKKWITKINNSVTTLYQDTYGLVWFGGSTTGLFCYDPNRDTISQYNSDTKNPLTLCDNTILSTICEDQTKTLWCGSSNGLNRYNRAQNTFTRFKDKDGFLNEGVHQILEDDHGNLWMSTGKGISKFNPQTGIFKNYYSSDEFAGINFYSQAGCRTENGEMYFGGENGFIRFHPDSIKDDPFVPPIVITSFRKFEKPFPFGTEVKLPHTDNFISFEFAALSYINSAENQYAYKMEGLDKDWVYCGTRRYASYPNMDPGKFVFRVKGSTSNRIWNEAGASLRIIINPPWWRTTWAYIFYVLFILAIIYFTWKMQLKRIKVKHEFELSRFEAQKLQEMDEIKTRFFTNISHEFRTPLTLILGPAKQLLERLKDEKAKDELNLIHRSARKLNRLVDELLDISRIDAGEMKLKACPYNFVSLAKEIVLSFHSLAERKNIIFKLNCNEKEIIAYLDRDKIDKILSNILSNAFKFTPEGGRVEVEILRKTNDVQIIISDTGTGIPKDKIDKIFDRFYQVEGNHTREQEGTGIGLALTRELVQLHKGRIEVESAEGKGSTFRLSFPLGRVHLKPEEIVEPDKEKTCQPLADEDKEKARTNTELEDLIKIKNENKIDIESAEKSSLPTVLIVEDNADVRKYIRMILENQYSISEAKDGEEGLDKSFEQIPDLIISDIMMPKLDGFQLCSKLKTDSRTSHIPVILLTAKATMKDKINGLEIGADDYIMKPFEASELKARIKNLLQQRKRLHEHFRQHGLFEIEEQNITSLDQKFIQKSIEVINNNLSNINLSVELLASNLAISKWVLNKKLSALTGDTPAELIKRIRLSKAAKLIERSTGNISEIALEVGFTNPAYFAECFKKQFGLSPSQYHHSSTIN